MAQDNTHQIQFYSEVAAPYFWLGNNSEPKGASVDLAAELSKRIPYQTSLEEMPWARAFQETISKPNVVLLSLLKTKQREADFQWLGQYHQVRASLVRLSQRSDIQPNSLEEAKQYRVGTIRGYGSADYLQSKGFEEFKNLVLLPGTTQLWPMLYEKRIDMVLANLVSDRYEIASIGLDPTKIQEALELSDLTLDLQIATGLKTSPEVTNAIQNAILNMKQDGVFAEILQKWGLTSPKKPRSTP